METRAYNFFNQPAENQWLRLRSATAFQFCSATGQMWFSEIENECGRQCRQAVQTSSCGGIPADLTFLLLFWSSKKVEENNFTLTNRGFTGHEHYPYFKIINMNGRLYDPVIARFFSPDKYVANSSFTQDFNRYSYARNNPLKYVDRTGQWYEDYYDDPRDPIELNGVNVYAERPDIDPFGNLWGIDAGAYDYLLDDFNGVGDPIKSPDQVRKNFENALLKSGIYQKNSVSNNSPNTFNIFDMMDTWDNVVLIPISDEVVAPIGLTGTGFGGALSWAAAETAFENAGKWTSSLKWMKLGGGVVGVVGFAPTAYNVAVKYVNGQSTPADWLDFGISGGLLITGLMLTNPVGIGIVVLGGMAYGIYRLGWGEDNDIKLNSKFGY